ncbi:MAG: phosphopyruvate hydratase [Verrucomicrobia bacterium]|nr:phosphopyruvate hydratase [Verrucomicrobiota bacterium]
MTKIQTIRGLEILDSRGNPTILVEMRATNGKIGIGMVPSGASTGALEALELRDKDPTKYHGKGVTKAIWNIENEIAPELIGKDPTDQAKIDRIMLDLDGTPNKTNLGANAILGVSLAAAHLSAAVQEKELFEIFKNGPTILPIPMLNVINGGAHANNSIDFQEFMIRPIGFTTFKERLRAGAEIFQTLKKILEQKGFPTTVGDEGGFAPNLSSPEEVLSLLVDAIVDSGYEPGTEVTLALDCAASFFYEDGYYFVGKKKGSTAKRTSKEQVAYLESLVETYPIDSLEDALDEKDWEGWQFLTQRLSSSVQLVGDDLFVTNPALLKQGIKQNVANAILIKPNQIGTLTETIATVDLAKRYNYRTVMSHRSGETEDTTIADLSVALATGQIKTGAPDRSDRTAKYNRLLYIEKFLM